MSTANHVAIAGVFVLAIGVGVHMIVRCLPVAMERAWYADLIGFIGQNAAQQVPGPEQKNPLPSWLIPLTMAAVLIVLVWQTPSTMYPSLAFSTALLCLAYLDLQTIQLPGLLTLPLLWSGLLLNLYLGVFSGVKKSLLGAVVGYLLLRAFGEASRIVSGDEMMAQGDAKFLAAIGAWLAVDAFYQVLMVAAITAWVLFRIIKGTAQNEGPFGPWLLWV